MLHGETGTEFIEIDTAERNTRFTNSNGDKSLPLSRLFCPASLPALSGFVLELIVFFHHCKVRSDRRSVYHCQLPRGIMVPYCQPEMSPGRDRVLDKDNGILLNSHIANVCLQNRETNE